MTNNQTTRPKGILEYPEKRQIQMMSRSRESEDEFLQRILEVPRIETNVPLFMLLYSRRLYAGPGLRNEDVFKLVTV